MHHFFSAAERCLSFQYYYRTDQFYNDGYDSTLTVTSSGSSTALLKIGDANTPLNKWTAVKVTVPSTPDLKVRWLVWLYMIVSVVLNPAGEYLAHCIYLAYCIYFAHCINFAHCLYFAYCIYFR